jgi:antitoxin ParD1/3/4
MEDAKMVTRNVVLTDAQDTLVEALVDAGRYQNASEAMRAGLRLLEREEANIAALKHRLAEGVRQAHDGELTEGEGADVIRRAFSRARQAS